jgi:hypothetical protein
MKNKLFVVLLFAFIAPLARADDYKPPAEDAKNLPASEPLANFQHFDHRPVNVSTRYDGKDSADKARAHLQANMDIRSVERTLQWNAHASGDGDRTLVIEPVIENVRFVTPGKRAFFGVLWGNSHLDVKLRLTDAATGQVIGEPHFYQQANAFAAGWAFGAVDRALLIRTSNMIDSYLRDNYNAPAETPITLMGEDTPEQTQEKQQLELSFRARQPEQD